MGYPCRLRGQTHQHLCTLQALAARGIIRTHSRLTINLTTERVGKYVASPIGCGRGSLNAKIDGFVPHTQNVENENRE